MPKVVGTWLIAVLLAAVSASAETDFTGNWRLNEKMSQDAYGKIYLVLGDGPRQGTGTGGSYESVNRGTFLKNTDRVALRRLLLDYVRVMETMEIEHGGGEMKISVGSADEFFSLLYLDGKEHSRQLQGGEMVKVTATWEDDGALRVRQVADTGAVLEEIFSAFGDDRIAIVFHLTSELADGPVMFRIVYDRAE